LKILLTGKHGQVGSALLRVLGRAGEVIAWGRSDLDLLDLKSIPEKMRKLRPAVIVNAAAYTAVDRAERERELAFAVNAEAVRALAAEARKLDALLVHFSTDYVFDGEKATPYVESDAPNPINVYGASKLAGERAIAESGCRHVIFRTGWVYSASGRNFVRAILAAAREKPELHVVNDQRGAPTAADAIAEAVAKIIASNGLKTLASGLYHLSAGGETTWYGFAKEILQRKGIAVPVVPATSDQYPAAAKRPRNSLLDSGLLRRTFGVALADWRGPLAAVLDAIH